MTTKPKSRTQEIIREYNRIEEYLLDKVKLDVDVKYLSDEALNHFIYMRKIQHPIYGNKWLRTDIKGTPGMPVCASPQYPIGKDINHITLYFRDKSETAHFKLRHTGIT